MKRLGTIAAGLAAGLTLNAGIGAPNPAATGRPPATGSAAITAPMPGGTEVAMTENPPSDAPYATIPPRNLFGLLPPPLPPAPTPEDETKNLPKIKPQGIMGIFGHYQVLFTVAPARPDPKVKEEYYTLHEGEMADEIEVEKIDNAASLVTFINHGIQQVLPLIKDTPAGGAAPAASGPVVHNGVPIPIISGVPAGIGNNGGVINFGAGRRGGRAGGEAAGGPGSGGSGPEGANGGLDFNASTEGRVYQPPPPTMSPDESTIMIEINRAKLMNNPHPAYSPNLLPPTPLTELNTPGGN